MLSRSVPILVIANSARMLTKLLVDNNFKVIAIDCYGDIDTRAAALDYYCVEHLEGPEFEDLLLQVREQFSVVYVLYGSGFEAHITSLMFLERHFTVIGNSSQQLLELQNKPAFFKTLERNSLPFPKVSFDHHPKNPVGLLKPFTGYGGMDVIFDDAKISPDKPYYWQEYIDGEPCSVTFIANGQQHLIVGFNQQRFRQLGDQPFIFSGLIAQIDLSIEIQNRLAQYIDTLLNCYQLVGICSLDFMIQNQQIYLLEINSRIPASAQLYDSSLIIDHLSACLKGVLPQHVTASPKKALHIVYAETQLQIPNDVLWPEWVSDRPPAGRCISQNQPICSIIVDCNSLDNVETLLQHRENYVKNLLSLGL